MQSFMQKEETLNLVLRIPYLGIFGMRFWKIIIIFEISPLEIVKNESSTYTVDFVIGSALSNGPGSAFSEDPCLGPLYKVCPIF